MGNHSAGNVAPSPCCLAPSTSSCQKPVALPFMASSSSPPSSELFLGNQTVPNWNTQFGLKPGCIFSLVAQAIPFWNKFVTFYKFGRCGKLLSVFICLLIGSPQGALGRLTFSSPSTLTAYDCYFHL